MATHLLVDAVLPRQPVSTGGLCPGEVKSGKQTPFRYVGFSRSRILPEILWEEMGAVMMKCDVT